MKEFGSSHEVVTLGLSLFVVGLAVGPMVLSPLSEVSESTISKAAYLQKPVIWTKTNLYIVDFLLPDVRNPISRSTEYSDDAHWKVLGRGSRKCVSQRCRRDGDRFVSAVPNSETHDGVYAFALPWTNFRSFGWRVYQLVHYMVKYLICPLRQRGSC